mgnify:FL=1
MRKLIIRNSHLMKKSIDWTLIGLLSPIGLLMGTLMVLGVAKPVTQVSLWMVLCIASAISIRRRNVVSWVLTALFIGMTWGILHNLVQAVYLDAYLTNNSIHPDGIRSPEYMSSGYWILLMGPFVGVILGVLILCFTWIVRKF